jgi:hypothetical protein
MYDLGVFSENLAMSYKPRDQSERGAVISQRGVGEHMTSHSALEVEEIVDIPHLKGQRPLLRKEAMYRTMVLLYECLEEFLGSREDSSRI